MKALNLQPSTWGDVVTKLVVVIAKKAPTTKTLKAISGLPIWLEQSWDQLR